MSPAAEAEASRSSFDFASINPQWIAYWNLVIRPPRSHYSVEQLGPTEFFIGQTRGSRKDLQLETPWGVIECSHFAPQHQPSENLEIRQPVVIYLHGNSGNRLEITNILEPLLRRGISLFVYDSVGCGLSGGEYVSLGWHERNVLATVVQHLRASPRCGKVGIWGRSMGAATTLLYAAQDKLLSAIVADSPFAHLPRLVASLAMCEEPQMPVRVPSWLVPPAMALLRSRILALAEFDIEHVVPVDHVPQCEVPALFVHGMSDWFIPPCHSEELFEAHGGYKERMLLQGDHNSTRLAADVEAMCDFFVRAFRRRSSEPLSPVPALAREPTANLPLLSARRERTLELGQAVSVVDVLDADEGLTQRVPERVLTPRKPPRELSIDDYAAPPPEIPCERPMAVDGRREIHHSRPTRSLGSSVFAGRMAPPELVTSVDDYAVPPPEFSCSDNCVQERGLPEDEHCARIGKEGPLTPSRMARLTSQADLVSRAARYFRSKVSRCAAEECPEPYSAPLPRSTCRAQGSKANPPLAVRVQFPSSRARFGGA